MTMGKKPTNTTEAVHRDPFSFFAEAMMMGSSGAIEHQEATGQRELVNSEALPVKMHGDARRVLESLGFKFGKHDGKDLFIEVEMPAGWKKVATDHHMWSKLLDDRGRERASMFYKAAFYDRDAFLNLVPRFCVRKKFDDGGFSTGAEVRDGEKTIHAISFPASLPEDATREEKLARYRLEDELVGQAVAWLKERYPDFENPAAYWDLP